MTALFCEPMRERIFSASLTTNGLDKQLSYQKQNNCKLFLKKHVLIWNFWIFVSMVPACVLLHVVQNCLFFIEERRNLFRHQIGLHHCKVWRFCRILQQRPLRVPLLFLLFWERRGTLIACCCLASARPSSRTDDGYTAKELPQEHVFLTLGLLKTNPEPVSASV